MNPLDAQIERVYTRRTGVDVPDTTPNLTPGAPSPLAHTFELVVEATSGDILANTGAPYTLSIVAHDITVGTVADPSRFSQVTSGESFLTTNTPPWPAYKRAFRINVTGFGLSGHIFKYYATLVSANQNVVSFAESPLFMLF